MSTTQRIALENAHIAAEAATTAANVAADIAARQASNPSSAPSQASLNSAAATRDAAILAAKTAKLATIKASQVDGIVDAP